MAKGSRVSALRQAKINNSGITLNASAVSVQSQQTSRGQITQKIDNPSKYVANELGISEDEAKNYLSALKGYTGDNNYGAIRDAQRGGKQSAKIVQMGNDVETYIDKAPKWSGGETYRGVTLSKKELNSLVVGATIDMGGTSSWSSKQSVATKFADKAKYYRGKNPVVFVSTTQKNGTGIRHLSKLKSEEEVLVSKNSKYTINDMKVIKGITYVYVGE